MNPQIIQRESFTVLGVVTKIERGSETPELFSGIWNKFESFRPEIESNAIGNRYYGINFPTDKDDVTDYLAGLMVSQDTPVFEGLEKRTVAGGQFAIFECPLEAIGECYHHIFSVWLPKANVHFNPALPVFEDYPEDTSKQPVCIHIPVTK